MKKHKGHLLIILALSVAVHFAFFGQPNETVFDEVHFGKFVSGYYTGKYYFDIHPPLGKLMIAGFAKAFDFQPEYSFINIGDEFPDKEYLALRFLPAIAGTLLPLIIYLLVLELGMSRMAAFTAALLIVFDNALLTQSRLILLDPFLLLFGFTSLLFYFKKKYLLMAIFAGLAISIKWTGLSFIALPILIEAVKTVKILKTAIKLTIVSFMAVLRLASFFLISLTIYFGVFALHFALLPNPGSGDAFMKPGFRENNVIKNIRDLNVEMYRSNQRLAAYHPYSSQFYTWPLMTRHIYYWVSENSRIYFFGNPVIWWASTAAVLILLWRGLTSILRLNLNTNFSTFLLSGYFLNLLPFIGVKRVMFLYHYLTALIFAVLILCYLIDKIHSTGSTSSPQASSGQDKNSRKIFTGIIIISIIAFLFFAPLSYGLPLSEKAYITRVWFASWR